MEHRSLDGEVSAKRPHVVRRSQTKEMLVFGKEAAIDETTITNGNLEHNEARSENDEERDQEEGNLAQESDMHQVAMAMCFKGKQCAFAIYSARTAMMEIVPDKPLDSQWTYFTTILTKWKPTVLLVQNHILTKVIDKVKELQMDGIVNVVKQSKSSFDENSARISLQHLRLPDANNHDPKTYFSFLEGDDKLMLRAVGCLVLYVEHSRFGVELDHPDDPVPFLSIRLSPHPQTMLLDSNALSSLGIFSLEPHPSSFKAGGFKEGLSLFGILNQTKTSVGSRCLRQWLELPSKDLKEIRRRQEFISTMMSPSQTENVSLLRKELSHVLSLKPLLKRMQMGASRVKDWTVLRKTCTHAMVIKEICHSKLPKLDLLAAVFDGVDNSLRNIAEVVDKIFDEHVSKEQNRFVVKPLINKELDEERRRFNHLPDLLTKIARSELPNLPSFLREFSVVYLPQLGFLIASEVNEEEMVATEGLEFMFASGNLHYFKNGKMRHLDEVIGDTQCNISDMENEIMFKLQQRILAHVEALFAVDDALGELDCVLSIVVVALDCGWVMPTVIEQEKRCINIVGGRHPLQELCTDTFLPNDTHLSEHEHCMFITGPNGSGKSIYLKQVGIIVLLAQIGSPVPAKSAELSVFDRIFTRIQTQESVSVRMSAFLIDTNQVAVALKYSSPWSLVLIDEYGKGTNKLDGISLAASSAHSFLGRESPPFLLFTTHFLDLFALNLVQEVNGVGFFTMAFIEEQMHFSSTRGGSEDQVDGNSQRKIVLLYQLQRGVVPMSYSLSIAKECGIPQQVLSRAAEATRKLLQHEPIPLRQSLAIMYTDDYISSVAEDFVSMELDEGGNLVEKLKRILSRGGNDDGGVPRLTPAVSDDSEK
eukprot:m.111820 g.111820  ORF g.111820 m.111820 type:complete len:876 (-) comp12770_c0_seq6:574-3201(-)